MITSLVVYLKPIETYEMNTSINRSILPFFYETLRKGDPRLASECHESSSLKPFTTSPFLGSFGKTSTKRIIVKGFTYWLRFTFLKQDLFDAFASAIFPMVVKKEVIKLENNSFTLEKIDLEKKKNKSWSAISSYESLFKEGENLAKAFRLDKASRSFGLKFTSPTTFRRGDFNSLFPESHLVFRSYLKRWNSFSPRPFEESSLLDYVNSNIVVSFYRLQTDVYDTGDVSLQGFKGFCRFTILKYDKVYLPKVITLVNYSFYSGTGQKTTMGMGMTKPIIKSFKE